jgi:hypothetical protein
MIDEDFYYKHFFCVCVAKVKGNYHMSFTLFFLELGLKDF